MKVFLQRVSSAKVRVGGTTVASLSKEPSLLLLVGIGVEDSKSSLSQMARKIAHLRIFSDQAGKFQHSVLEVNGGVICIPQFTLFADTKKGRRPEFFGAMRPPEAEDLFDAFCEELLLLGITRIERGVFGAHMEVELTNDGPVSLMLENN